MQTERTDVWGGLGKERVIQTARVAWTCIYYHA